MGLQPDGAVAARGSDRGREYVMVPASNPVSDAAGSDVVVNVVLLGELRRLAGCREAEVHLPPNSTVHALARALRAICDPKFERVLTNEGDLQSHVAVFLNGAHLPQNGDAPTYLPSGRVELMLVTMYEGG